MLAGLALRVVAAIVAAAGREHAARLVHGAVAVAAAFHAAAGKAVPAVVARAIVFAAALGTAPGDAEPRAVAPALAIERATTADACVSRDRPGVGEILMSHRRRVADVARPAARHRDAARAAVVARLDRAGRAAAASRAALCFRKEIEGAGVGGASASERERDGGGEPSRHCDSEPAFETRP